MEYGGSITLTTPGPDITFNAGDYLLDPEVCSGLEQAPLRFVIDKRPQTKGGIVQASLRDARPVTLGGYFEFSTVSERNSLEQTLRQALEAIEWPASGTLTVTPTGGSAMSLTVHVQIPLSVAGGTFKRFQFGLIAPDPDFT